MASLIVHAAAMIFVIAKSSGGLVERWTALPVVYLAIVSVLANILLWFNVLRGVEIYWGVYVKDKT